MQETLKIFSVTACTLALTLSVGACMKQTRPTAPPEKPAPSTPEAPADLKGATVYQVNPKSSRVDILVFRGGSLSRMGHNHVMTSHAVTGRVWVNPTFARSGFELSFPVKELVVDDNEARKAAGADFPPDVPEKDRDGTRTNMLRTEVLDAEHYPTVKLRAAKIDGSLAKASVTAHITIKDQSRDVEVPTAVAVEGNRLTATGEFDINQSDFGMKPFSVALGALTVKDPLHIKFRVIADKP
jgi:polyisoprenoid-binding protein YceI